MGHDEGIQRVWDPRGSVTVQEAQPAPRLERLDGTRIAVLDNTKWNAGSLLRKIAARLEEQAMPREVRFYKKESFSRVAAPDLLAEIARDNDAVVTAIGD